jgi:hypothetical protein
LQKIERRQHDAPQLARVIARNMGAEAIRELREGTRWQSICPPRQTPGRMKAKGARWARR